MISEVDSKWLEVDSFIQLDSGAHFRATLQGSTPIPNLSLLCRVSSRDSSVLLIRNSLSLSVIRQLSPIRYAGSNHTMHSQWYHIRFVHLFSSLVMQRFLLIYLRFIHKPPAVLTFRQWGLQFASLQLKLFWFKRMVPEGLSPILCPELSLLLGTTASLMTDGSVTVIMCTLDSSPPILRWAALHWTIGSDKNPI